MKPWTTSSAARTMGGLPGEHGGERGGDLQWIGPNARDFSVGRGHSAAGRVLQGVRPRTQPREGGHSRGGARWLSQRRPLGAVPTAFGRG